MKRLGLLVLLLPFVGLLGCSKSSPTNPAPIATTVGHPWPADAESSVCTSPTLSWVTTARSGATFTYDVYLGATNPPNVLLIPSPDSTRLLCPGLIAGTKFYWKVVAKDGNGAATSSPVWSFTTNTGVYSPAMVPVAAGSFAFNSTTIHVSAFRIDRYETTYDTWAAVRGWAATHGYPDLSPGTNGATGAGTHQPVANVNFYDMAKWCNARSEMEGLTPVYCTDATQTTVYRTGNVDLVNADVKWAANGYRLPTEAEWRFAARGGAVSRGYVYSGGDIIVNVAWIDANSGNATHTVGELSGNELGLFDMSGNVWEEFWDWFSPTFPTGGTTDPKGPDAAQTYRSLGCGSYIAPAVSCDLAARGYDADGPGHAMASLGFRCVTK